MQIYIKYRRWMRKKIDNYIQKMDFRELIQEEINLLHDPCNK